MSDNSEQPTKNVDTHHLSVAASTRHRTPSEYLLLNAENRNFRIY